MELGILYCMIIGWSSKVWKKMSKLTQYPVVCNNNSVEAVTADSAYILLLDATEHLISLLLELHEVDKCTENALKALGF